MRCSNRSVQSAEWCLRACDAEADMNPAWNGMHKHCVLPRTSPGAEGLLSAFFRFFVPACCCPSASPTELPPAASSPSSLDSSLLSSTLSSSSSSGPEVPPSSSHGHRQTCGKRPSITQGRAYAHARTQEQHAGTHGVLVCNLLNCEHAADTHTHASHLCVPWRAFLSVFSTLDGTKY